MKNILTLLLVISLVGLAPVTFAQTDTDIDVTTEAEVTTEADTDTEGEADTDVTAESEAEDITQDTTSDNEDPAVEPEDETEVINPEFDVAEEQVTGEVIEITDQVIIIETESGNIVEISRGGGALLSPFVRQANLGDVQVGQQVDLTVAQEVSIEGEVTAVNDDGSISVITSDGQQRTITPGASNVEVRQNGQVVTDFNTLSAGDEIEVVYTGELISDVDTADTEDAGGWLVPVVIILIVLALAGLLAKRNRR